MAHAFSWPRKRHFYPVGNTPAVCLTRDIAPEENANILLLGCGDPRNVLYSVFCEPFESIRKLDFTCCDIDPAILARNILLLAMISDGEEHGGHIWNFFFHMHIDEASHSYLVECCRKLVECSDSIRRWNQSSYGSFLRMSTEYTLSELRRHWTLYADMHDLPTERLTSIRIAFAKQAKSTLDTKHRNLSPARSAGPLVTYAYETSSDQYRRYWKSGTTFSNPKDIAAASLLNPTFVYSLAGEGCSVHYGLDPMMPFHFAAVFGNAKSSVMAPDIVKAAKSEFSEWCTAFRRCVASTSASPRLMIRVIVADATIACRAFTAFALTGTLKLDVPVAQFKTQVIDLSEDEYTISGAPTSFNVIETSNLVDHLGLLNVLTVAVPLLSHSTQSRVLYTESLLHLGEDATKEFTEQLYGNITTIGVILDLCPVDYLSGFSTRSNTHELMTLTVSKGKAGQFHQVTTWKSPSSGDPYVCQSSGTRRKLSFDSRQLGTFLYDMYYLLFEQEDSHNFWRINRNNIKKAFQSSTLAHYTRESFVLFLKLARDQLGVSDEEWTNIMDYFFSIHTADTSLPMDSNNFHDFCAHLYRHGVYTAGMYCIPAHKIGRFAHWAVMPHVVRIIFTVPREKLKVLEESPEEYGTPLVQCHVRGNSCHNIFSSAQVAYGRVTPMGTKSNPWATFKEDPLGSAGKSSLVVSFTMSSTLLTEIEPPENLLVCFSLKSSPANTLFVSTLGIELTIHAAKFMDESQVIVLPEPPLPSKRNLGDPAPSLKSGQIGQAATVSIELDEQCELVTLLISRISVDNNRVKSLFQSGAMPEISQISPCVMRISFDSHSQDLLYPFPIIGSQNRARLARKSLYIEVIVPVSGPFKADGMRINPFSVTRRERIIHPWSVHRVNLARMPVLDTKAKQVDKWLNAHVGSMMSTRERALRKKHKEDVLMYVKDSLHTIFVRASGIQHGPARRLFALRDDSTKNCDTILFISDIRYDLHSHTMICDGYVLPLQPDLLEKIVQSFGDLVSKGDMIDVMTFGGEMRAWKQLLPAFVERCRTSWQHGDNCEYVSQGRIPLTEAMECNPLCSCGQGKDTEGMSKVALWKKFAPYVTRVALSPLFAVSYLEAVGRDPAAHKCSVCRGKGKPNLKACKACKKVRYCSETCQRMDWKAHKSKCKP